MLLTEMLSRDEMKQLMTSFNKVSTLHPRKEKSDVQEIKDQIQEMARVAKDNLAQQTGSSANSAWYKALGSI